jgi:hypothetical protein
MKKLTILFLTLIIFSLNCYSQLGIGMFGGLATPSDKINDVYNSSKYNAGQNTYDIIKGAAATGFCIGAKARLPLSSGLMFIGGISWNRFPQSQLTIDLPSGPPQSFVINTTQNIIPVTAGISYYVISIPHDSGIFGIYGTGELSYNFISNSVTVASGPATGFPLNSTPTINRVGAGIGAGFDLDIKLFMLNLEGKYNFSNIIGRESGEGMKNYFTLTLGVFFGSSGAK